MEWISCKDRLPENGHLVLVCRNFEFADIDVHIQGYDIGRIKDGRWILDSQNYCVLPCKPTIKSGIISHWMELPEMPEK